jgi:protein-S-isoprenylcysteine O-methyltransferase Ste14
MIGEELAEILAEVALGRRGRRAAPVARLFFGLLGAVLGIAGAWLAASRPDLAANPAPRAAVVCLFGFLGAFGLFNVALARRWRWPWVGFGMSLVAVFAARILLGN